MHQHKGEGGAQRRRGCCRLAPAASSSQLPALLPARRSRSFPLAGSTRWGAHAVLTKYKPSQLRRPTHLLLVEGDHGGGLRMERRQPALERLRVVVLRVNGNTCGVRVGWSCSAEVAEAWGCNRQVWDQRASDGWHPAAQTASSQQRALSG